jgi:SOS-response transcriptional repressor LexA
MGKLKKPHDIGQRLLALRKKLELTQTQIAERMCFSRNYISLVEHGTVPSLRFARALELLEQAPVPYFEHSSVINEVPYEIDPQGGEQKGGLIARVIPLLSWDQAGTAQAWEDAQGRDGFVGFNLRDPKAVAVQICGDNMAAEFPHGTIAIVYPSRQAKSGDLVITRLKDGTVLFKRLHVDGNNYTFISLNPIYPAQRVEKSKVEMIFPVGGTFRSHL